MNPRFHFRSPARALVALVAFAAIVSISARQADARPAHLAPALIDNTAHMDANDLDMFVTNHGSFAYDLTTGNAGLEYPKGAGKARYQYRLVVRYGSGEEATVLTWVNVPGEATPSAPSLRIAAANPSGNPVRILYGLPVAGQARVDVYDIRGRWVATLTNTNSTAGWHEMTWSGRDGQGGLVASRVYLLRLEFPGGVVVRKLTVAR